MNRFKVILAFVGMIYGGSLTAICFFDTFIINNMDLDIGIIFSLISAILMIVSTSYFVKTIIE